MKGASSAALVGRIGTISAYANRAVRTQITFVESKHVRGFHSLVGTNTADWGVNAIATGPPELAVEVTMCSKTKGIT